MRNLEKVCLHRAAYCLQGDAVSFVLGAQLYDYRILGPLQVTPNPKKGYCMSLQVVE